MPEKIKGETTNAVLAQKLDSFKELVDTKFQTVERTLIRIENNSSGYASTMELNNLKLDIEKRYVTDDKFAPVRNVVYGLVGLILIAVVGAIVALVITR